MPEPTQTNLLYYGDNLDILRRYLPDAAVNLVYLDPPFATDAQLLAFGDTWVPMAAAPDGPEGPAGVLRGPRPFTPFTTSHTARPTPATKLTTSPG
jgi:hypothetical protein